MRSLMMALKSIGSNKLRSFLTMLGIMIGVLSIVVLVAIAQGANEAVVSNIESLGTNLLSVNMRTRRNNPLTMSSLRDLAQQPGIARVAPIMNGSGTLKAGLNQVEDVSITGTVPGYDEIRNWTMLSGRFITGPDIDNRSFVVVLGQEAATELFGSTDALGMSFTYMGYSFQVVGVLDQIGTSMLGSGDKLAVIPFTLAERLFQNKGITNFYVSAEGPDSVAQAEASVREYLDRLIASASSSSSYNLYNQSTILETLSQTTAMLTMMLGGIAAISLLVGGIGIMNIMLVSVTERTREIGIRKAIGANRRNILSQFLIEALALSVLGGLFGLGLSYIALRFLEPLLGIAMPVSPMIAGLAVGFSLFVGVVFGIYPANKASRLRPIDALRFE